MVLVELTIPFETSFDAATQRKEIKYEGLIKTAQENGYDTKLITIEVGSRGVPNPAGFNLLQRSLSLSVKECTSLMVKTMAEATSGSFTIWTNRNRLN